MKFFLMSNLLFTNNKCVLYLLLASTLIWKCMYELEGNNITSASQKLSKIYS